MVGSGIMHFWRRNSTRAACREQHFSCNPYYSKISYIFNKIFISMSSKIWYVTIQALNADFTANISCSILYPLPRNSTKTHFSILEYTLSKIVDILLRCCVNKSNTDFAVALSLTLSQETIKDTFVDTQRNTFQTLWK